MYTTLDFTMATEAGQRACCLCCCDQGALREGAGHAEVKTFIPAGIQKSKLAVRWQEDGEAVFHYECWKKLKASAKKDAPIVLIDQEKEMVREAAKTAEFFDSDCVIQQEGKRIARMLKTANHAIAFTGAGISTAAGIGDFRGKAGKWTEQDRKKQHGGAVGASSGAPTRRRVPRDEWRPTYTHEALVKLVQLGHLKFVISQNCDGIHRLSGLPRDKISELHGNSFHERCEECGARYELNHPAGVRRQGDKTVPPKPCPGCRIDHRTGRRCQTPKCKGYLMDTIINFGDSLESEVISTATAHAKKNDFVFCLGSSLRVTPACDLVEMGQDPIRMAICNRQPTPFDSTCYQSSDEGQGQLGSRVYGDCDALMREVMKWTLCAGELQEWEEGRDDRMHEYNKLRH